MRLKKNYSNVLITLINNGIRWCNPLTGRPAVCSRGGSGTISAVKIPACNNSFYQIFTTQTLLCLTAYSAFNFEQSLYIFSLWLPSDFYTIQVNYCQFKLRNKECKIRT